MVKSLVRSQGGLYETFDSPAVLDASRETPELFCSRSRLLCVDEAQNGPWIFPVIKNLIGTRRKPGQFVLTGSVRFTLKKEIRESLTGRIVLFELLPFNLSEAHQEKASSFIEDCFEMIKHQNENPAKKHQRLFIEKKSRFTPKQILNHMLTGGMPIPCFSRDANKRDLWYQSYFETMITRDLPLVDKSLTGISYRQGISFLRQLALMQGRPVHLKNLSANSALSVSKAKKILDALTALSLVDLIPPEISADKAVRKMRVEWKDIGLWNHLTGVAQTLLLQDVLSMGIMIAQEIRTQISLSVKQTLWSAYQNRDGANLPWIFRRGRQALAMIFLPQESPRPYDYRVLKNFIEKEPQGLGIVIGAEKSPVLPLAKNIFLVPYTRLF